MDLLLLGALDLRIVHRRLALVAVFALHRNRSLVVLVLVVVLGRSSRPFEAEDDDEDDYDR
jgi:hypothetical protein